MFKIKQSKAKQSKASTWSMAFAAIATVASIGTAPTAYGQALGDEVVEEVIVTGSRIRDRNVISSSHVSTVSGADIRGRGITRVEDFLNDLPQISPGQSITNSNGSNGIATVNLRNLGSQRTLVLLNGRRMAPGTAGGGSSPDLNAVPTLLLERVEVLTGGASSIYGSDAVGGVVNFILDDEFEGFKASVSHSFYQHENDEGSLRDLVSRSGYQNAPDDITTGHTNKFSLAFGGKIFEGKGHVTAFAEKTNTDPILQGDYDISACALGGGVSRCAGSSTIPPGRWADFGGYHSGGFRPINPDLEGITQSPTSGRYGVDLKVLGDEFVNRDGQVYNFNPTNFFQRPDERINTGFFGKYEVNEHLEAYADITYMKGESNAQIAFSGTFGNISSVPCYNPLLSEQQYNLVCGNWMGMGASYAPDFESNEAAAAYLSNLDIMVGNEEILGYRAPIVSLKRNVEGGPRQSITTFKNLNQTFGIRGEIVDGWDYDAYYQKAQISYTQEYRNDLSVAAIGRGTDVINVNGTPTCVSVVTGTDSSCIPYNLFQGGLPGDGGIQGVIDGGAALQSYIANATYVLGDSDQTTWSAYVTGDTKIAIPGAPSSVSLVLGYETKETTAAFRPDRASRTGDRSGSGGATLPISGAYDVDEWFLELGVPITDGLSVDLGYRISEYSTGQDTDTYKVGGFWRVNDSIAVRAAYQTAVRHANIGELFSSQGFDLTDIDRDPCSTNPTASMEQCARTGLDASLYGTDLDSPADQYNILEGGNPQVRPEEAESITFGVVFTPDFIPGLTLTIDAFDITVEDGIDSVDAETSLDMCIATGDPTFCGAINRHPTNGTLWLTGGFVRTSTTNISEESTRGVDVIFDYTFDTAWGPLAFEGVTTYLDSYELIELPGTAGLECAGSYGGSCGKNPLPKLAGNYKLTLSTQFDTDVSLAMRYLKGTDDLNVHNIDFDDYTYFDMTAVYQATDSINATVGVSNLLDDVPGYTSNAGTAPGNGNTFPGYFDALGRYVHITVGVEF